MKKNITPPPRGKSREYICLYCGATFVDAVSAKRKYCSRECYLKHSSILKKGVTPVGKKPSITKKCEVCGKPFKVYQSKLDEGKGRFCSRSCYIEYQRETMQGKPFPWKVPSGEKNPNYKGMIEVKCTTCGKAFEVYPHRYKDHENLFCCVECSRRWLEKIPINESQRHIDLKETCSKLLTTLGWVVDTERWITVNGNHYRVDVYGELENRKLLVECGYCPKHKLEALRKNYDVFHFSYKDKERKEKELKEYAHACVSTTSVSD